MLPALPAARWELTAPESYMLRYVDCTPRSVDAFSLALQELVARDALRRQGARIPGRLGIGTRVVWMIAAGPALGTVTEPALTTALAVFERVHDVRGRSAVDSLDPSVAIDGVTLGDLRRQAAREFGGSYRRYLDEHLVSALRARGLLDDGGLRTAEGRRADDALEEWLAIGRRRLPNWAANPRVPAVATDFLLGAAQPSC